MDTKALGDTGPPPNEDGGELFLSLPLPAADFRAAAARARALQAMTTTPRLKRYLGEMIARYEERAFDIEGSIKA
jgi:hypothetical protein